jgi:hypothetical protein
MLRLALPLVLLAACEPAYEDDIYEPLPDAQPACSGVGGFALESPKTGVHYTPHLDVHIGSAEIDPNTQLVFSMIDDTGTVYQWQSFAQEAPPPDGPDTELWTGWRFHYELAPGHRYDLNITYCVSGTQSATFFTTDEP